MHIFAQYFKNINTLRHEQFKRHFLWNRDLSHIWFDPVVYSSFECKRGWSLTPFFSIVSFCNPGIGRYDEAEKESSGLNGETYLC